MSSSGGIIPKGQSKRVQSSYLAIDPREKLGETDQSRTGINPEWIWPGGKGGTTRNALEEELEKRPRTALIGKEKERSRSDSGIKGNRATEQLLGGAAWRRA